jgi:hypothetical protein
MYSFANGMAQHAVWASVPSASSFFAGTSVFEAASFDAESFSGYSGSGFHVFSQSRAFGVWRHFTVSSFSCEYPRTWKRN